MLFRPTYIGGVAQLNYIPYKLVSSLSQATVHGMECLAFLIWLDKDKNYLHYAEMLLENGYRVELVEGEL